MISSHCSGKGSWTPYNYSIAFSCLLTVTLKKKYSFSKPAWNGQFFVLCWYGFCGGQLSCDEIGFTKDSKSRLESGWLFHYMLGTPFNPLTTNDSIWCRLTLAACYQLAHFFLKIGFALAKKGKGEVGGFQHGVLCAWQLPWLAIEEPWLALAGPHLTLSAQTGSGTTPLPL